MSSRRGNSRENRVRDLMAADGWFAMCGRASLGPADVLAVKDGERPKLVQVKSTAGGPYERFQPRERRELLDAAAMAGGEAWLVHWPPRRRLPAWIPSDEWPAPRPRFLA